MGVLVGGEDDSDDEGGAVVPVVPGEPVEGEPVEEEPEALVGAAGRRQPATESVATAAATTMATT